MNSRAKIFSDIEVAEEFKTKNELLLWSQERKSFLRYGTEPDTLYWKELSEDLIRRDLFQFCYNNGFDLSNVHRIDSAVKALKLLVSSNKKLNSNRHIINLKNFAYNCMTGELYEKSPDYLNTVQFPIEFDENAECPIFDKFLDEVLPDKETQEYVLKIIAYILIQTLELERAFLFTGAAGSGKGTLVSVFQNLLGAGNYSNIPIHQLANANNRFIEAELIDKYLNISTEMSATKLSQDFIKAYSGGDSRTCDRKWISAISYKPTAKLLMLSNELPELNEIGNSILSRYVIVTFPNQFRGTPNEDTGLKQKLAGELSGIFNRVREQYQFMFSNGSVYFDMPDTLKRQTRLMLTQMNSVSAFLQDECSLIEGSKIVFKEVRARYEEYCKRMNYQSLKQNQFKAALTDFYKLEIMSSTKNLLYVFGLSIK